MRRMLGPADPIGKAPWTPGGVPVISCAVSVI
jgi:hypothetical protein